MSQRNRRPSRFESQTESEDSQSDEPDISIKTNGKRKQSQLNNLGKPASKRRRRQLRGNRNNRYSNGNNNESDTESDDSDDLNNSNDINMNGNNNNEEENDSENNNSMVRRSAPRRKKSKMAQKKWKEKNWCSNTQTANERMEIRVGYRNLANETTRRRADIVDPTNSAFQDVLIKQDNLYDNVQETTEAHLDIEQSVRMTLLLKDETTKLANQNFTIVIEDFIDSIIENFGDDDMNNDNIRDTNIHGVAIDWSKFGKKVLNDCINTAPNMSKSIHSSMFKDINNNNENSADINNGNKKKGGGRGSTQLTAEQKLARKNRWIATGEQKSAQVITMEDAQKMDKTETKSRIKSMSKLIKNQHKKAMENPTNISNGFGFYNFVINPNSFSETVENIFDLSFVAKEGKAMIGPNTNNADNNDNSNEDNKFSQPMVSYISQERRQSESHSISSNNGQCIVKIDFNKFLDAIDFYNITESQISRPKSIKNKKNIKTDNDNDFADSQNISDNNSNDESDASIEPDFGDNDNSNDKNNNNSNSQDNSQLNSQENENTNENESESDDTMQGQKSKSKANKVKKVKRKAKAKVNSKSKSKAKQNKRKRRKSKKGKREIDDTDSDDEDDNDDNDASDQSENENENESENESDATISE